MKKTILLVLLVLVASVALIAAAPSFEKLARLTVWNRTGDTIYIQLTTDKDNGGLHYYLTIKPGVHVFTVERKIYDVKYWSCGASATGIADILTRLSLTFTDCRYLHRWTGGAQNAAYGTTGTAKPWLMNFGEPSEEKIHNPLKKYMWRLDSLRQCWTLDADGELVAGTQDAAGCTWVDVNYGDMTFRTKTFQSPYPNGNYWFAWRFSTDTWTARQVHWQESWSKGASRY